MCNGSCANIQTDTHNCGACGHDCLGATCALAVCEPTTLAAVTFEVMDLQVDANNLYWSTYDDWKVWQLPKTGGTAFSIVSIPNQPPNGSESPIQIALDGSSVYFGVAANFMLGWVGQVPVGGGTITTVASGDSMYGTVALSSNDVYFSTYTHVADAPKTGVDAGAFTNLASDASATWLASDGTNVYWASGNAILAIPQSGGSERTVATLSFAPTSVITDGVNVYAGGGAVIAVPVGGGTVTTLAQSGSGVSTDGASVYYTDSTQQIVARVPVAGGTPLVLAKQQTSPSFTAVDQGLVYWCANGHVLSAPK